MVVFVTENRAASSPNLHLIAPILSASCVSETYVFFKKERKEGRQKLMNYSIIKKKVKKKMKKKEKKKKEKKKRKKRKRKKKEKGKKKKIKR